jgi:hypothetical protein
MTVLFSSAPLMRSSQIWAVAISRVSRKIRRGRPVESWKVRCISCASLETNWLFSSSTRA